MKNWKGMLVVAAVTLPLVLTGCALKGSSEMVDGGHAGHGNMNHGSGGVMVMNDKTGVMLHAEVPEKGKVNSDVEVVAHLTQHDKELDGAKVTVEYSKDGGASKSVDATAAGAGEYKGTFQATEAGSYEVRITAEKGDIKEQVEAKLTIE